MKPIKINLRNIRTDQAAIKIPLGDSFIPVDSCESAKNLFLRDEIEKAINPIEDFEKIQFEPFSGVTELIFQLKATGDTELTYGDFGYSNEDVFFRRNRFKNSFLKLNFYDTPIPTNQRLAFQIILFNQVNNDQRDVDGSLLDVSIMPITYRISDPVRGNGSISEGFYLYWLKQPSTPYPITFYMYASYNNALDGVVTPLQTYDSPVTINLYNQVNFTRYVLASIGGLNEYSVDTVDRTIDVIGKRIITKLYKPNIV